MRVLAFDCGLTCGFAALGDGRDPFAGSRRLKGDSSHMGVVGRAFDGLVREIILQEKPGVIAFASPFVGQIFIKEKIINGRRIKPGRFQPVGPEAIRPLMGLTTVIEMIADELGIRCVEDDEQKMRRAFLTGVPRKSKDIKEAVVRACELRRWPAPDHHAADALCVASYVLSIVEPKSAHKTSPLFAQPPPDDFSARDDAFHWHREAWGWSLRSSADHPRAILTKSRRGWMAQLLEPNKPSSDLCASGQEAATWATSQLVARECVGAGSTFRDFQ